MIYRIFRISFNCNPLIYFHGNRLEDIVEKEKTKSDGSNLIILFILSDMFLDKIGSIHINFLYS